jgi:hypothetical protein
VIEAIVVVGLLILFIKEPGCGLALLGLGLVAGALVWYFAFKAPADRRDQEAAVERAEAALVRLSVRYDRDSCPVKGYPLRVRIANGSHRTLESVHWTVKVTERGHSTDLGESSDYSSDLILAPGTGWNACYELPAPVQRRKDAKGLRYEASMGGVGWR